MMSSKLLFYSVKGPELLNMYVGQSEENIREGEALFCYHSNAEHSSLDEQPF